MDRTFEVAIVEMEGLFALLEKQVPSPARVDRAKGFVYRYKEKTLAQALIQKLVRVITGLRSALELSKHGFFQEVATLQRGLEDFNEEIYFLSLAEITKTRSNIHDKFLEGFFDELFDEPESPMKSLEKKRSIVSRKDIRKAIEVSTKAANANGAGIESAATDERRVVSSLYNSYTHASSPQILELYGGAHPHYHLRGMLGTPRVEEHKRDLWNQFYRSALSFSLSSVALGDKVVSDRATELANILLRAK